MRCPGLVLQRVTEHYPGRQMRTFQACVPFAWHPVARGDLNFYNFLHFLVRRECHNDVLTKALVQKKLTSIASEWSGSCVYWLVAVLPPLAGVPMTLVGTRVLVNTYVAN